MESRFSAETFSSLVAPLPVDDLSSAGCLGFGGFLPPVDIFFIYSRLLRTTWRTFRLLGLFISVKSLPFRFKDTIDGSKALSSLIVVHFKGETTYTIGTRQLLQSGAMSIRYFKLSFMD